MLIFLDKDDAIVWVLKNFIISPNEYLELKFMTFGMKLLQF